MEESRSDAPAGEMTEVVNRSEEEGYEIVKNIKNVVVHTETTHTETTHLSTEHVQLNSDQTSTDGEETSQHTRSKKAVHFQEEPDQIIKDLQDEPPCIINIEDNYAVSSEVQSEKAKDESDIQLEEHIQIDTELDPTTEEHVSVENPVNEQYSTEVEPDTVVSHTTHDDVQIKDLNEEQFSELPRYAAPTEEVQEIAAESADIPTETLVTEVPLEPPVPEVPSESPVSEVPLEPAVPEVPSEPPMPEIPSEPPVPEIPSESPVPEAHTESPPPEVPSESPPEVYLELQHEDVHVKSSPIELLAESVSQEAPSECLPTEGLLTTATEAPSSAPEPLEPQEYELQPHPEQGSVPLEVCSLPAQEKEQLETKVEPVEIQQESLKTQLKEIIHEIDMEVGEQESQGYQHTWKPKGVYKIQKTEVKYEDVVPIEVPKVALTERPKAEKQQKAQKKETEKVEDEHEKENKEEEEEHHQRILKVLRQALVNGEVLSPLDIPVGIPLLAKILPKENDEEREKIPLQRLFTPASDWEEIVPHKKKAYASSCFYRPDHPTIDDQLELAHKISTSLVDETNKASKGQSMYIKRKNRSAKWIHQGEEGEMMEAAASQYDEPDEEENEICHSKEKPPLKLVISPQGHQDHKVIQQHYDELLATSQTLQQISSMEVGREIASNLQSPTGKGAALFAKRKKRMDKFIIDETTVQQQQQQQQNVVHDATATETTTLDYQSSNFESNFSSQTERQTVTSSMHKEQTMTSSSAIRAETTQAGGLSLPDLTGILTKPKPPEKKTPSLAERGITKKYTSSRSHVADTSVSKKGFQSQLSGGTMMKSQVGTAGKYSGVSGSAGQETNFLNAATNYHEDLSATLRPGTPPAFFIPNGIENFVEQSSQNANDISASVDAISNERGAVYKAEVRVVQQSSPIPPSPIISFQAPQSVPLEDLTTTSREEEKRKSFNLAPKGWGTYANYYTPVHLGAR